MSSETEHVSADKISGTNTTNDDSKPNDASHVPDFDTNPSTGDSEVHGKAYEAMFALINN